MTLAGTCRYGDDNVASSGPDRVWPSEGSEARTFSRMTKRIAILQSNYIPWKGYFDIVAAVDEFLIFDEAQFTRRDWRNRNKIIIDGSPHWLTIPVSMKAFQSYV